MSFWYYVERSVQRCYEKKLSTALLLYSKFLNNHSLLINHSGRRQGQGQDQDQGQGQGQDHLLQQRAALPPFLVLALTLVLVLTLALAPSGMINKKGVPTFFTSTKMVTKRISNKRKNESTT